MQWALEQRFPRPEKSYEGVDTLNRLQSYAPEVQCNLACGSRILRSSEKFSV